MVSPDRQIQLLKEILRHVLVDRLLDNRVAPPPDSPDAAGLTIREFSSDDELFEEIKQPLSHVGITREEFELIFLDLIRGVLETSTRNADVRPNGLMEIRLFTRTNPETGNPETAVRISQSGLPIDIRELADDLEDESDESDDDKT